MDTFLIWTVLIWGLPTRDHGGGKGAASRRSRAGAVARGGELGRGRKPVVRLPSPPQLPTPRLPVVRLVVRCSATFLVQLPAGCTLQRNLLGTMAAAPFRLMRSSIASVTVSTDGCGQNDHAPAMAVRAVLHADWC